MTSATLGMNEIKVEAYGNFTTVPNDIIAKLMYYLHCVSSVIEYDDNTLTDYQNYDNLTLDQLVAVLAFAKIFDPQIFIDAHIFIVDQKLLPDSSGNQFYKIIDETIGFHVNQEIMIAGRTVKVLKVMACNKNWLLNNYYHPINTINKMINQIKSENQCSRVNTETGLSNPIGNAPLTPSKKVVQEFKSNPVYTTCFNCHRPIVTTTKLEFNFLACCCFLCTGLLYICVQALAGNNICCCDVIHICPNCGKFLGKYKSC